jgi:hypothetical protein
MLLNSDGFSGSSGLCYHAKQTVKQNQRSEYRNPKTNPATNKSQIGKIQNTESEGSLFGILHILVI